MMSQRFLVPAVLFALTATYAVTAFSYDPASRGMPLAISAVVALLLIVEVLMQTNTGIGRFLRRAFAGTEDLQPIPGEGTTPIRKEFEAFAWIGAFLLLAIVFGFYIAIPVYVFSYLRFYARKSLVVSVLPAVCLVGLLYLLFKVMLGYDIFSGLIAGGFL